MTRIPSDLEQAWRALQKTVQKPGVWPDGWVTLKASDALAMCEEREAMQALLQKVHEDNKRLEIELREMRKK